MILKIQLPIFSNDVGAEALVYNEERSFQAQIPITDDLIKKMEGKKKDFFLCSYNIASQKLEIIERAKWQRW